MLSNLHAAELQFRHESATRDRELALLGAIRDRRAAEATVLIAAVAPVVPRIAPPAGASIASRVEPRRIAARATRAVWARPIGVKISATSVTVGCAVA